MFRRLKTYLPSDPFLFVLFLLTIASGAACYALKGGPGVFRALVVTGSIIVAVAPQLAAGLMVGALVQRLINRDVVAHMMGKSWRMQHLAMAQVAGALTPGGAFAFFPLIRALRAAGVHVPVLITYLTAWTLFGFTRVVAFELPLLGGNLTLFRVVVSLPLPLLAGILAGMIAERARPSRTE